MKGSLNVTTDSLHDTGIKYGEIGTAVSGLYQSVVNSIDLITSKNSWQGQSAVEFQDAFKAISVELKERIEELNQLGPVTMKVAQGYQDTEDENSSLMRTLI